MRVLMRDWPALGRKVSAIALGSAHFGAKMPEETAFEVMDAYIRLGGNVLDTARVYGDFDLGIPGISEKTIGKWLASRKVREDLILSTKGAHPPWFEFSTPRLDRKSIESDMEESLEALGVPGVELYFLHRDDVNRSVADILESLNGLVEAGKARLLGASNWSAARITEANAYAASHGLQGFSVNQPQWSLAYQHHVADATLIQMDRGMYDMHRRSGLVCMPYSSQAQGFFTKLCELGEAGLPEALRRDFASPENARRFEAVLKVREQTGLSVGAIALGYLTGQPDFFTLPIVGVSRAAQVEALREAADAVIPPEAVLALTAVAGLRD
jgi:aryl-alcohol dehydrogenase-like predicted oxidoreductase